MNHKYRFIGSDLFSYTISDGTLTATAQVVVNVSKDVTPPSVVAPVESIYTARTLGTTVSIKVAWSASDPGSGVVKYELWRQVDAGTWGAITLPTATTTSIATSVTVGHSYRFRVRARDFNGNISAVMYGPTVKPYVYQEGSITIAYGGTWAVSPFNVANSGGYTPSASIAGRTATFTISARDIAFVAPKSSIRGSVRIYVDGVLATTISEKSTTTLYRQVLWARHFSTLATHAVRLVVVGTGRVDVDCFLAFR